MCNWPQMALPPIVKSDLPLKSSSLILPPYPWNHQVQFTPQIGEYNWPPPPQIVIFEHILKWLKQGIVYFHRVMFWFYGLVNSSSVEISLLGRVENKYLMCTHSDTEIRDSWIDPYNIDDKDKIK